MAGRHKKLNYFKEKCLLIEEEKTLTKMLDKFRDQLNRLKIEELALMSLMKMQSAAPREEGQFVNNGAAMEGTSAVSDISSVTSILPVGLMVHNHPSDTSTNVNQQEVNLDIDSHFLYENEDIGEEEEEEEEEEEDDEEMEEDTSANKTQMLKDLTHFLEDV